MGKKITVSLSIILICTFTFINGYTFVYPSYADSSTDQWTSVTTNQELAEAFRYYCKSRNLAIEGSVLDALTTFTTDRFNQICNTLGIDVTALQAHLKRSTDSNGKIQFLFDQFGVTAFNRIFAEFLQNNDIEVGDTVDDETLYSGSIFTDYDGNNCLVYILARNQSLNNFDFSPTNYSTYFVNRGTFYKYKYADIVRFYDNGTRSISFHLSSNTTIDSSLYYSTFYGSDVSILGKQYYWNQESNYFRIYRENIENVAKITGSPIIVFNPYNNLYSLCSLSYSQYGWYYFGFVTNFSIDNNSVQSANVYLTTNNTTINNNTYTDNRQTVINNEGDVYNYDSDDEPPVDHPSGGGGGTVTPPSDSGGSDGDVSFPDFNFQLPQIDWSLGDLSEKFPFSIPFDLIAFFTVLNAEPQAPSIDANIPLGSWYTWHFQADFSQFNNWATIIRNVEFIAFCIGLIYLTIRLVKG